MFLIYVKVLSEGNDTRVTAYYYKTNDKIPVSLLTNIKLMIRIRTRETSDKLQGGRPQQTCRCGETSDF